MIFGRVAPAAPRASEKAFSLRSYGRPTWRRAASSAASRRVGLRSTARSRGEISTARPARSEAQHESCAAEREHARGAEPAVDVEPARCVPARVIAVRGPLQQRDVRATVTGAQRPRAVVAAARVGVGVGVGLGLGAPCSRRLQTAIFSSTSDGVARGPAAMFPGCPRCTPPGRAGRRAARTLPASAPNPTRSWFATFQQPPSSVGGVLERRERELRDADALVAEPAPSGTPGSAGSSRA